MNDFIALIQHLNQAEASALAADARQLSDELGKADMILKMMPLAGDVFDAWDLYTQESISGEKMTALDNAFARRVRRNLMLTPKQLIFPDHRNVQTLKAKIESVGGIDTCYGGIGVHGHVAYNEPEPNVRDSDPRIVYLNDFTRTINTIRAQVGGNLEGHPRKGITLGLRQILGARRIRLYCRNGIALDWANTVLRLALFGQPGDDYPVTHIRDHKDYIVVTDEDTARKPKFLV